MTANRQMFFENGYFIVEVQFLEYPSCQYLSEPIMLMVYVKFAR